MEMDMGRVAGTCSLCGRTTTALFTCGICGASACPRCYARDVGACKRCLRRGLWVGSPGPE